MHGFVEYNIYLTGWDTKLVRHLEKYSLTDKSPIQS